MLSSGVDVCCFSFTICVCCVEVEFEVTSFATGVSLAISSLKMEGAGVVSFLEVCCLSKKVITLVVKGLGSSLVWLFCTFVKAVCRSSKKPLSLSVGNLVCKLSKLSCVMEIFSNPRLYFSERLTSSLTLFTEANS